MNLKELMQDEILFNHAISIFARRFGQVKTLEADMGRKLEIDTLLVTLAQHDFKGLDTAAITGVYRYCRDRCICDFGDCTFSQTFMLFAVEEEEEEEREREKEK